MYEDGVPSDTVTFVPNLVKGGQFHQKFKGGNTGCIVIT
jgi:hypothetical protein